MSELLQDTFARCDIEKHEKKEEGCNVTVEINCGDEHKKSCPCVEHQKEESACNVKIIVNCSEKSRDWHEDKREKEEKCNVTVIVNCCGK